MVVYAWVIIAKAIETIGESRRELLLNAMCRALNYKLWKEDNHAICFDSKTINIKDRLNYINENPVRNGFVVNDWDYVYSSAIDY